ncbi:MAG TPA: TetR/AcrR family transcriptional regulator [Rhizomicrobium sp.]
MKKIPTQERSRQTVEALIEATARTVAEMGWALTTTNHIADRAGVSVGSLYQYFENREELFAALIEREIGSITAKLDEQIPFLLKVDAPTAIRAVLEVAFAYFESNERLFTELANNWQATGSTAFVDAFEGYMLDAMRMFMAQNYAKYEPIDLNAVSFIMSNGTMFVLSRFISRKPKGVTKESLIAHITELYSLYFESKARK